MSLTIITIIAAGGLFVLVYLNWRSETRMTRGSEEQRYSAAQRAAEINTVATLAATLMAGILANEKRYEELRALEEKRESHVLAQLHEIAEAAGESRKPAEWAVSSDDPALKIMDETIRGATVFAPAGRKKVLKLAWATFEEVKSGVGRDAWAS
jgi:hypothetical protein